MPTTQDIAAFIDKNIDWPRRSYEYELPHVSAYPGAPRPSVEALGRQLFDLEEFKALRLATWLNSPDGQMIADGVELVAPPLYRGDVELLVAAMKYAADLQYEDVRRARAVALGAVGLFGLIALITWGSSRGSPA